MPAPSTSEALPPARPTPELNYLNREFWTGGAEGELRIQRCTDCRSWQHPPRARCPRCGSGRLAYPAASGRGTVYTFTLIHHAYRPGLTLPVVVALVELDEQPGLRVTSNITGCPPAAVAIGQPVSAVFEDQENGIFVPLFEPIEKVST
ncbi:MAG TPA: OB-fold domain-containing protein [Acidimicrobiales bacterium]|nr:OB-fold domain-containing protein [Acidimicrobiales bacterium]